MFRCCLSGFLLLCIVACSDDEIEEGATAADIGNVGDENGGDEGGAALPDVSADVAEAPDEGGEDTPIPADEEVAEIEDVPVVPDVEPTGDTVPGADDGGDEDTDGGAIGPPTTVNDCFPELNSDPEAVGPNYDQYAPVIGSHCQGTNHQDIQGVEQVVFLGDSVTVGTPNLEFLLSIQNEHFYRNKLAGWLVDHFSLSSGELLDWALWKAYDYFTGKGGKLDAGALKNCSKWGARNDDFLEGGGQVAECFPEGGSDKVTLVVFTMGGNDVSSIAQKGGEATPEEVAAGYPQAWATAQSAIEHLENTMAWLTDPTNFPNGVFVVFANPFEFTDGTGQTDACKPQLKIGDWDLAQSDLNLGELVGFNEWADPAIQADIVIWLMEQYMRIAVDYQVDLAFMLESFCGHGYVATGPLADPEARCYLGPEAALWFDITCFHPNSKGHAAIFELFQAIIAE